MHLCIAWTLLNYADGADSRLLLSRILRGSGCASLRDWAALVNSEKCMASYQSAKTAHLAIRINYRHAIALHGRCKCASRTAPTDADQAPQAPQQGEQCQRRLLRHACRWHQLKMRRHGIVSTAASHGNRSHVPAIRRQQLQRDPIIQPSLLIGPVQDELQTRCSAAFDLADVDVRADDMASMIAVLRCGVDHVAAVCILPVLHASAHQRAEMFPQAPCI